MRPFKYNPSAFNSILLLCFLFVFTGCATTAQNHQKNVRIVNISSEKHRDRIVPAFRIYGWQEQFNRIGRVTAREEKGREKIIIDTKSPVFYCKDFSFTTDKAAYRNRVYRIHFPETPFSIFPFHFAAGNNPGILVVMTMDIQDRVLLVTTVNTCGCYVNIIPTDLVPDSAYPENWPSGRRQRVYGESLPSRLDNMNRNSTLLITIRPEVHRVMDVEFIPEEQVYTFNKITAQTAPLDSLKSLPLATGKTTSMYYSHWPLKGHVKGALKPWETLLLSLVSLDLYVGMDKEYGNQENGNPFYTSLKPWNRQASDMNDFACFLQFMGWKL